MEDNDQQELQSKHYDHMNRCAYECFESNPFGKELLESFKMGLLDPRNGDRKKSDNLPYDIGQEDLIRQFILMVDLHKAKMKGGK